MVEKIEEIVARQTEAISNLKSTRLLFGIQAMVAKVEAPANFVSSLIRSLPPVHDVAKMAGVDLPDYLGSMKGRMIRSKQNPSQNDGVLPSVRG